VERCLAVRGTTRALLCFRALAENGRGAVRPESSPALATRIEVAGGEPLEVADGGPAASFPTLDVLDAVELALSVLADAREQPSAAMTCVLTLGELVIERGVAAGETVERAFALAEHAAPFELVLDDSARAYAGSALLFVGTRGEQELTLHLVDQSHPYRADCRAALSHLDPRPPLPAGLRAQLEEVRQHATSAGAQLLVLHAAHSASALEVVERLAAELTPALCLHVESAAQGLLPLGGLQGALSALPPQSLRALPSDAHRGALTRCAESSLVTRDELIDALSALLRSEASLGRVWVVVPGALDLDPPSLAVLHAALERADVAPVCFVPMDDRGSLPQALTRIAPPTLFSLGALDEQDRI
jgi:hypothetical protein